MLHQLDKLSEEGRKFIYHIEQFDKQPLFQRLRAPIKSTRRDYVIHFNLQNDAEASDLLHSYFLGRMIDENLQRAQAKAEDG